MAAGMRRDDLYIDEGVASPVDTAKSALEHGDTLVVTTPDRLGRPHEI